MSEPVFPKIDLPGKWRWRDTWQTDYGYGYDRVVKLQRKGWFLWYTYTNRMYKSSQRNDHIHGLQNHIDSCVRQAVEKYHRDKGVTVYPA